MRKMTAVLAVIMVSAVLAGCGSKRAEVPETAVLTSLGTSESVNSHEEDTAQSIGAEGEKEGGYEDNFAVESATVSEFAEKIKTAVAAGDMEALADLTAFPVYVSIAKEGVKTREDFMALGAEKVFTPELKASVAGADTSNLSPSMAGFVVETDGGPNIIFGVVEGKLAISGINY